MNTFSNAGRKTARFARILLTGAFIALVITVSLSLAGCGPVEIDNTAKRVMPAFLVNMIAKGFWWTILATFILNIPVVILAVILKIIKKRILGAIVIYGLNIFFAFYVWHIRGQVYYLIMAIFWILVSMIGLICVAAEYTVKADTNPPAQNV